MHNVRLIFLSIWGKTQLSGETHPDCDENVIVELPQFGDGVGPAEVSLVPTVTFYDGQSTKVFQQLQ